LVASGKDGFYNSDIASLRDVEIDKSRTGDVTLGYDRVLGQPIDNGCS
jgi:hypothetical protein